MTSSLINTIEKDELQKVVNDSNSIRDVLYGIGLSSVGGPQHKIMQERLKRDDIACEHFYQSKKGKRQPKTFDAYIKLPGLKDRRSLRIRILRENLLPYECKICSLSPIWNGNELTLQLDHIDGNTHNNRLSNLRFLCPNCHSQTPTFCGRTRPRYNFCVECKKSISSYAKRCQKCAPLQSNRVRQSSKMPSSFELSTLRETMSHVKIAKHYGVNRNTVFKWEKSLGMSRKGQHRKVNNRPTKDELRQLIVSKPFLQIGKMYGVSDNAVRKWCKWYGLPYKKKELKMIK